MVFNRRLDKENVFYMHNEYYLGKMKNEIMSICRKMESSGDNHISESSQSQKDKYQIFSLIVVPGFYIHKVTYAYIL